MCKRSESAHVSDLKSGDIPGVGRVRSSPTVPSLYPGP